MNEPSFKASFARVNTEKKVARVLTDNLPPEKQIGGSADASLVARNVVVRSPARWTLHIGD